MQLQEYYSLLINYLDVTGVCMERSVWIYDVLERRIYIVSVYGGVENFTYNHFDRVFLH